MNHFDVSQLKKVALSNILFKMQLKYYSPVKTALFCCIVQKSISVGCYSNTRAHDQRVYRYLMKYINALCVAFAITLRALSPFLLFSILKGNFGFGAGWWRLVLAFYLPTRKTCVMT